MAHILGIDAGNSKTLAMVADEHGTVLGAGRSGSGSHQAVGLERSMEAIRIAADEAMSRAALQPAELSAVYYALAGADLQVDFDILRPAIARDPLAAIWCLDNDVMAALRSGTDSHNAVAVVLGTGFNGAGRNSTGQEIRLAALGWISGDWGGGGEMAREAIRLSMRHWDGRGRPTMLHDMILSMLDMPDMEALIVALHTRRIRESRYLAIVPAIFEAACKGDEVAEEIIVRSGVEVATTAATLLRRLDLLEVEADVVLGGSVFKSEGTLLFDVIRGSLEKEAPRARIAVPDVEPAAGAVLLGMELAGIPVDTGVRATLTRTSAHALRRLSEARL
jgi:N-acetylglucosamine kinase-like BadF-type ATPase